MNRWLILLLVGFALGGCQAAGGPVSDDCPSPDPCDDTGQEARPLFAAPMVTFAAARPLWPGCPSTLQVMVRPRPIVFRAVRPDDEPEAAPDPDDWVCEAPEAPLLRADLRRSEQNVAAR
ncbi:MAG: hypothetical protein ABSE20_19475 [Acetobacteraceae bacterium]|jgi:hypothetical protein